MLSLLAPGSYITSSIPNGYYAGLHGTSMAAPHVAGATVVGEIASQDRGPHVIIFKKRRRKHYRRRNGHRQDLTSVTIREILG